jgi:ribosome biogenesis GTPase
MPKGRIIKLTGGNYYVDDGKQVYKCRGRGRFRNENVSPKVGDICQFQVENVNEGYILELDERKNDLVRPSIVNVDQAIIITSCKDPEFSTNLLDRFLVLTEFNNIESILVFSKEDLMGDADIDVIMGYKAYYESIGYTVYLTSPEKTETNDLIKSHFKDKLSVIVGQSGVGKSTLLNAIDKSLKIKTGETSKALGRGRHTTRHTEFIDVEGGLVADTPGFSSLEFIDMDLVDLKHNFIEIFEYSHSCKYRGCNHLDEPKCAVKAGVESGEIAEYRYVNYKKFYEEIKNKKPRY